MAKDSPAHHANQAGAISGRSFPRVNSSAQLVPKQKSEMPVRTGLAGPRKGDLFEESWTAYFAPGKGRTVGDPEVGPKVA